MSRNKDKVHVYYVLTLKPGAVPCARSRIIKSFTYSALLIN